MMANDLVREAAHLMDEQAGDYEHLEAACALLCEAFVTGEAKAIDTMTRSAEVTLHRMRARLVRIIRSLTAFADARAAMADVNPLSPAVRSEFDTASTKLMAAARRFVSTGARAALLTSSGATFAAACIETCGIQPTTYRQPYARHGEVRGWA